MEQLPETYDLSTHLRVPRFFRVEFAKKCSLHRISRKMVVPGGDGGEGWWGYLQLAEVVALIQHSLHARKSVAFGPKTLSS